MPQPIILQHRIITYNNFSISGRSCAACSTQLRKRARRFSTLCVLTREQGSSRAYENSLGKARNGRKVKREESGRVVVVVSLLSAEIPERRRERGSLTPSCVTLAMCMASGRKFLGLIVSVVFFFFSDRLIGFLVIFFLSL